ncbi:unnamed protein product [Absidia cylindrospora]
MQYLQSNFSRPVNLKDHLKTLKHQQNVSDLRSPADASTTTTNDTHSPLGNNPPLDNDDAPGNDSPLDGIYQWMMTIWDFGGKMKATVLHLIKTLLVEITLTWLVLQTDTFEQIGNLLAPSLPVAIRIQGKTMHFAHRPDLHDMRVYDCALFTSDEFIQCVMRQELPLQQSLYPFQLKILPLGSQLASFMYLSTD